MQRAARQFCLSACFTVAATGLLLLGGSGGECAEQEHRQVLIASSGQAGMNAQSAAKAAARSSSGSDAAAAPAKAFPDDASVTPGATSIPASAPAAVTPPTSSSSPASFSPTGSSAASMMQPSATGPTPLSPQLRGVIGAPPTSVNQGNSVESFFQCPPVQNTANTLNSQGSPAIKKSGFGRAMWHVMDNIGIPVSTGKLDESLDPSIRRGYVNPPLPSIDTPVDKPKRRRHEIVIESPAIQTSTSHSAQSKAAHSPELAIQRKIPEGELEGTDLPGKTDAQK